MVRMKRSIDVSNVRMRVEEEMKNDDQAPQETTKREEEEPEAAPKTRAVPFFGRYAENVKVKTSIRAGGSGNGEGKYPYSA